MWTALYWLGIWCELSIVGSVVFVMLLPPDDED